MGMILCHAGLQRSGAATVSTADLPKSRSIGRMRKARLHTKVSTVNLVTPGYVSALARFLFFDFSTAEDP